MSSFSPVVGELSATQRSLAGHIRHDANRAADRAFSRQGWMMAGLATAVAVTPAACLLMLAMPLSLGAIAIGAAALPTLGVGAMAVVAGAVATTTASGLSARKNEKFSAYLEKMGNHLENGGTAGSFAAEINKEAGFFERLSNHRMQKKAMKNPILRVAVKYGQ